MNIYLVRHGQSLWQTNQTRDDDSELTELGKRQSYYLNSYISQILEKELGSVDIYVSPLRRAVQTVHSLNRDYILSPEIKEASFHVASSLPQFKQPYMYTREISQEPNYKRFKENIKKMVENIISLEPNRSVYLYTHGGVIKTFLRIIHDNDSVCYAVNNCSITKISWERSRWHIDFLNKTSFLPEEYVT